MEGDNVTTTLGERFEILRRRWAWPAIIAPSLLLLAVFVAYSLPPMYRSSGTIMLEPSSVPAEFVQTVTSYADQQFELVQRRVMTQDSLVELVEGIDPYPNMPEASARQKARMIADNTEIERVDPVTLETLAESNAFSIHYHNPDPERAKAVADALMEMFIAYNQRTRSERATATYEFLRSESRKLAASIRDMERRRAEFKTEHGDALPEAHARNLDALTRARQDYDALQAQIRLAQQREAMLSLQLAETPPTLTGAVSDVRTQIATLRAELAAAERRYTPEHPDIKRLRHAIEALVEEQRSNPQASGVRPDNPEYMMLASQVDAAQRELAALRASAARASSQIEEYSRNLKLSPGVEREYAELERDYTIAREQFHEIQARLKEADLAAALVTEDYGGDRFALIRQPGRPSEPYRPNRLGIILIGLLLGVAAGFGLAMLAELSDPTVRGADDLQRLTGQTMIAAVPRLLNRADMRSRRLRWGTIVVLFGFGLIAVSAVVVGAAR